MRLLMGFLYLISLPMFADQAEINYLDFFYDYVIHESYRVAIDPAVDSLASLKAVVNERLGGEITSNFSLVGYGSEGAVEDFFAASRNTDSDIPLARVFSAPDNSNKTWFIYFIDKSLNHYITDKKPLQPSSPFAFLAAVGMRSLIYF